MKNKPTSIEKDISKWAYDPNFSIEMLKERFEEKAPDSKFGEALQIISIPYKSPLAHYLLCVYEADGFNRKEYWTSPGRWNNTIEHILPQDVNPNTENGQYWISQFGTVEECDLYLERLGNYAFLTPSAQSQAKNASFELKKIVYREKTDMRLTQELIGYSDWNPDNINKRQKRMAEVLVASIAFNI